MSAILEASGLAKRFGGVRAVDDVSLQVAAGEVVALIGPNGAGKSTCFGLLSGALSPDAGEVRLEGRSLAGLPAERRARLGIGRTFQTPALFGSLTAREAVTLGARALSGALGAPWRRFRPDPALADPWLERLGLAEVSEEVANALSYGDQKRLELAVVLSGHPRLLLLDEPTAGMAPEARASVLALAAESARADGTAVLFTEHDMEAVFGQADRILVLHQGRLIASGAPTEIAADPRVRAVYLGGRPIGAGGAEP